jgi:hypothetical protein
MTKDKFALKHLINMGFYGQAKIRKNRSVVDLSSTNSGDPS